MKTSEFRRKVEEMGYSTITTNYRLRVFSNDTLHASIMRDREMVLIIDSSKFDFIKLCIEYAETPIAEREEEKKYRVRIPDSPERTPVYALCKLVNGCVVINQTNESNFKEHDRYRLTEAEIKRNHEYLWQFAKEVKE